MEIKPIKTERDYRRVLSRIEMLMDARPGSAEEDELDVLATLVEAYEEKHFPVPDAHPLEIIRFVMEQNDMIDKDLMQVQFASVLSRNTSVSRTPWPDTSKSLNGGTSLRMVPPRSTA